MLVARLFPEVAGGAKTSTIRFRERHIVPGPMTYVCEGDPSRRIIVEVIRCTTMPLSRAASFLGRESDWPREVMLEGMREHYPTIEWEDEVQIVEHLPATHARQIADRG